MQLLTASSTATPGNNTCELDNAFLQSAGDDNLVVSHYEIGTLVDGYRVFHFVVAAQTLVVDT